MNTIAPQGVSNEDWDDILDLWEGFLENYNAFKSGKMTLDDEDKYKLLSSPGPFQYRAFTRFFDFFKEEEKLVEKHPYSLNTYELVDSEKLAARPTLEFLQKLSSPAYEAKGKNIVMASGSFWEQSLETRQKVISYFEELHVKGAKVSIFARASWTEAGINNIIEPIKNESRFGLKKRIAIHFIKADKDFVQLEFPHTESSLFRLTMLLDVNKLEPELKKGKTKEELLNFFDELIKEAF